MHFGLLAIDTWQVGQKITFLSWKVNFQKFGLKSFCYCSPELSCPRAPIKHSTLFLTGTLPLRTLAFLSKAGSGSGPFSMRLMPWLGLRQPLYSTSGTAASWIQLPTIGSIGCHLSRRVAVLAVLALCLRLSDRSELLPVIKNNAFLMRVIDAAAKELWKSSHPSIWSLPDRPDYFVERHFFKDLKDRLFQVSLAYNLTHTSKSTFKKHW